MPQVALLVETALGSGRQILKGISQFVHEKNDWDVFHYTGSLGAMVPEVLGNWEGDGMIARISNKDVLDVIRSKGIPVVDILGNQTDSEFPKVVCNNEAITRMVLDHYEIRGFRSYGFFGIEGEVWSIERESAYVQCSKKMDGCFSILRMSHRMKQNSSWKEYLVRISQWLDSLPKPVGIFICSDQFAPDIIAACSILGVKIPEDVALIGVDNDLAFCEVVRPSLSSVRANHVQVGYAAAKLLSSMMSGETELPSLIRIEPFAIEVRQSTDVFALQEEGLKKAIIAIKARACGGVSVDEIAELAGYSRSVLQRKFKEVLGRTVHDMIVDVRVNRAKELLTMTNLSIIEVALRAGFNHQEYLGTVFKRFTGVSPARYRKMFSKI